MDKHFSQERVDISRRHMLDFIGRESLEVLSFLMIVSRTDEAVFLALQAACPDNLHIVEHVAPTEIWGYLSRARVLVNTSIFEGFPNTFLQSAVAGAPIVSLGVDPDSMMAIHGCGICAGGDMQTMREAVVKLSGDNAHAEVLALAAHRYTLTHHEAGSRIAEFDVFLREVLALPTRAQSAWWTVLRRFAH